VIIQDDHFLFLLGFMRNDAERLVLVGEDVVVSCGRAMMTIIYEIA
jgi:hypothetical protein